MMNIKKGSSRSWFSDYMQGKYNVEDFCESVEAGVVPSEECLKFISDALSKALKADDEMPPGLAKRSEKIGVILAKGLGLIGGRGRPVDEMYGEGYEIALYYANQLEVKNKLKKEALLNTADKFNVSGRKVRRCYENKKRLIKLNENIEKTYKSMDVTMHDLLSLIRGILAGKCEPKKDHVEFIINTEVGYIRPIRSNQVTSLVGLGLDLNNPRDVQLKLVDWLFSNVVYETLRKRKPIGDEVKLSTDLSFGYGMKFVEKFVSLYRN